MSKPKKPKSITIKFGGTPEQNLKKFDALVAAMTKPKPKA